MGLLQAVDQLLRGKHTSPEGLQNGDGVAFLVAAVAGQLTLSRQYAQLIAKNPRHRVGRAAWLALYLFVAIQMAWVLRPFIGDPSLPTRFFRAGAWGNAYVEVAELVWRSLFR